MAFSQPSCVIALALIVALQVKITAVVAVPLFVAAIFEFAFIIALTSRTLGGRISHRAFMVGILSIIAAILIGVVLMFQPITPKPFNLGFDFVLDRAPGLQRLESCHTAAETKRNRFVEGGMEKHGYRFSFGPWNIHEGADPFGPAVRPEL